VQAGGRISSGVRKTRTRIGFIAQQFNLVGRLSLFTNVALGSLGRIPSWRGLLGLWPEETKAAAMAALARVGVADYAAQRANTLSGGQQQRGAIARAIVNAPKLVFADEPTGNLDTKTSIDVMALFQELWRGGLTIVFVTHEPDVARYASRILVVRDGKIVSDTRQEPIAAKRAA
jgi:phosphonate transport system ATP-binding protein